MVKYFSRILLLIAGSGVLSNAQDEKAGTVPRFESEIRPIFAANCLTCHGSQMQQAGLDLRDRDSILKGGRSGPAIQRGLPESSLLLEKVIHGAMPPTKTKLSEREIDLIRRWIEGGALIKGEEFSAAERISKAGEVTEPQVMVSILNFKCLTCHGRRKQEGGLDLRTRASILKGGKSGPAMVLGKPDESLLIQKIAAAEMPPAELVKQAKVIPVTAAELDTLSRWIAAGASPGPSQPSSAGKGSSRVKDEDLQFWSFQPPVRPPVPEIRQKHLVRSPIDAFLLQKLESAGLGFSPQADRAALLRRAYIDLIGMPPEPDEVRDYLNDDSPLAYDRMVDRLLASPHYGERWGRFWLDIAGYADSGGKVTQDIVRPFAYRYRDYVIRAFNEDKPYDRFLLEQLAGDELFDYKAARELNPGQYDSIVATGFMRTVADGFTQFVHDRLDMLADQVEVVSSSVMGLTLACARCHDHKYDPISQRDYYRFSAIFRTAYDPYDWIDPPHRQLDFVPEAEKRETRLHNEPIEREIQRLESSLDEARLVWQARLFEEKLDSLPKDLSGDVRRAFAAPPEGRSDLQKNLVHRFESWKAAPIEDLKQRFEEFDAQAKRIERDIEAAKLKLRPAPGIPALFDMGGVPTPVYLLLRGNAYSPGELVAPGVPSALARAPAPYQVRPPWPGAETSGRRLALARWLVQPDHPLTARVMVNRIWQHHFGAGLVKTPDNFGSMGERPSHPELLDWLATEFVRRGWSIKAMHRILMLSTAYRQSSRPDPTLRVSDPDNSLLSRFPMHRMDAESLRDSILRVSGRLDPRRFGPADEVETRPDGEVVTASARRSVYLLQRRSTPLTLLDVFDAPRMDPNCLIRRNSNVASQALQLWNSDLVRDSSRHLAARIRSLAGNDIEKQVETLYLCALTRRPSPLELKTAGEALRELKARWSEHLPKGLPSDSHRADWLALATLCHVELNSAEFLFVP